MASVSVCNVRDAFFKLYDNQDKYENIFHAKDVQRLKDEDLFVKRMINGAKLRNGDANQNIVSIDDVLDHIKYFLKWRLEYGINDITPADIPKEYFYSGMIKQASLSNGDILLIVSARKFKRIEEFTDFIFLKGFMFYYENYILPNILNIDAKYMLAFDMSRVGISQADPYLIYHSVPISLKYYPEIVIETYFINIPFFFKPFLSIFLTLVPGRYQNKHYKVDANNAADVFGADNVPDILGGPLKMSNLDYIQGISDIETVGVSKGFKRSNIEKFKQYCLDAKNME